jgi:purine-nucleoside phosphorylase
VMPGVVGHQGQVIVGNLGGCPVIVLSGRIHFYEGYPLEKVTFPVRTLAALGVKAMLLTNAAGGINQSFRPGEFMLVEDHINFMGANPLRGMSPSLGERFIDLSDAYDHELRGLLKQAAGKVGIQVHSGVYLAVSGPNYETPAEIRAFRQLGADAVGMSTVPEVIVARQCGMRVAALSCITNLAAGVTDHPITHQEVLLTASATGGQAAQLITEFLKHLPTSHP